jgi:uncharacterized protein
MGHPVSWFQIQGGDAEALQAFYKKVFGWKMSPAPGGGSMMLVSSENGGIDGGIGGSVDGNKNVSVYVGVTDMRKQLAKIQAAGGQPAMEPFELAGGMGHIAGFLDPAGNWIGLWARPKKKTTKRPAQTKKAAKKKAPASKGAPPQKRAAKRPAKKRRS